jgi:HlyD family secretion protein
MQLPFINKDTKKPAPWFVGLAAAGLVGTAATTFVMLRPAARQTFDNLTVPATQKTVTTRITASGDVVPVRSVNLNPKNPGWLEARLVKQGDRVQQGQLIARMENRVLQAEQAQAQAQLDQARASLALLQAGTRPEVIGQAEAGVGQAQAQVAEAQAAIQRSQAQLAQSKARLQKAQADINRYTQLYREGTIALRELETVRQDYQLAVAQTEADERAIQQAQASLQRAESGLSNSQQQLEQQQNGPRTQEIQQAEAQVQAANARLQAIQTQLEDTYIRAPFDGVITQTGAEEGAYVTPTSFSSNTGSATYIATLANDLEILAKVPQVDISQIKVGQEVEVTADSFPGKTFKGVVRLVAPEAKEDASQKGVITFEVRVKMLTGKDKLRSGMTTDLAFLGQKLDQALMVPTVAIVTDKGQTGVLVPGQNNKPRFQAVTIGPNIGNETQILDGIQAGDSVFVELPDGTRLDDITKGVNKKEE